MLFKHEFKIFNIKKIIKIHLLIKWYSSFIVIFLEFIFFNYEFLVLE